MNLTTQGLENQKLENSHEKAITDLFAFTKINTVIDQLVLAFLQRSKSSIKSSSSDADPSVLTETLEYFENEFPKEAPLLKEAIVDLYKQVFSESDLEQINAFYRSEIGERFLTGSSVIEKNIQQIADGWASEASKSAFERAIEYANSN